jgi:outer membrane lipoprotein SlyB
MKKNTQSSCNPIHTLYLTCIYMLCIFTGKPVFAQDTSSTASLNKKLGMFIFPAKDQKPEQQQKDEAYCYEWAVKNSGVDPLNMEAVKPDSVATGRQGEVARGAAKGAAAGVAIGAIAGDAGEGAAIGAVAGGLAGRRARKANEQQQKQQAQKKAESTTQSQIDSFKKAYTACLTGKGYTVQ